MITDPVAAVRARFLEGLRYQRTHDDADAWRAYCPETPTTKQAEFLACGAFEALFGGAAGPGKSSGILMAALLPIATPRYAGLLLRRTYADLSLPGAIMDRAGDWWGGTDAKWNDKTKTWAFPSSASITFGYLQTERDKYRYQGSELQFIGFDELTQFMETMYRYLISRARRAKGVAVSPRIRSTSNPGGIGHAWVRARFIDDATRGARTFVPARLEDNPYLDAAEYERSLAELDPITRAQLRTGDWDVRPAGGLFDRADFVVLDAPPTDVIARVTRWDFAATEAADGTDTDATVGVDMCLTAGGMYVIENVDRSWKGPAGVEARVRAIAHGHGPAVTVVVPQDPGQAGKAQVAHYKTNVLPGYDVRGIVETGSKLVRARPLSAAVSNGKVAVVRAPWNPAFFDEMEGFSGAEGGRDDQVDAASGAYQHLAIEYGGDSAAPIPPGLSLVGGTGLRHGG